MIKNPDPRVKWAMDIMDQEGEVWSVNKYLWKLCVCQECLGWRNSTFALFRSSLGWLVEPTSPFPSEHSLLSWTLQEMPWTGFLWGVDLDLKQTWKLSLYLLLAGQIWPVQSCSAPSPLLLAIGIRAGWREGLVNMRTGFAHINIQNVFGTTIIEQGYWGGCHDETLHSDPPWTLSWTKEGAGNSNTINSCSFSSF